MFPEQRVHSRQIFAPSGLAHRNTGLQPPRWADSFERRTTKGPHPWFVEHIRDRDSSKAWVISAFRAYRRLAASPFGKLSLEPLRLNDLFRKSRAVTPRDA